MAEENNSDEVKSEGSISEKEVVNDVDKEEENRPHESHSRISKNITITQNATNSHPLLYSPVQHFPDLIPEKPRGKISVEKTGEKPEYDIEKHLCLQMPELAEYNETLPGI